MLSQPLPLLKPALRLLLAWLVLSLAGIFVGQTLVDVMRPLLATVAEGLSDDFSVMTSWRSEQGNALELRATITNPDPQLRGSPLGYGASMTADSHLEHILVPVVLVLALTIAWPVARWQRRVAMLATSVPAALLALLVTTPFLLAGKIEIGLQRQAAALGIERAEPLFLDWMLFTEVGGRWLIPLILAAGCAWFTQKLDSTATPETHTGR